MSSVDFLVCPEARIFNVVDCDNYRSKCFDDASFCFEFAIEVTADVIESCDRHVADCLRCCSFNVTIADTIQAIRTAINAGDDDVAFFTDLLEETELCQSRNCCSCIAVVRREEQCICFRMCCEAIKNCILSTAKHLSRMYLTTFSKPNGTFLQSVNRRLEKLLFFFP